MSTFMQPWSRTHRCLAIVWLALLLAGCAGETATGPTPIATPTISPLFLEPAITPTVVPTPTVEVTTPIEPTVDRAVPTLTPTAVPLGQDLTQISIYADTLASNWSLTDSVGMRADLAATTFVYAGKRALAVTPKQGYGSLQFSVEPGVKSPYRRDKLIGVSFWLGSGEHTIAPQDLLVSIHGSNALTYWKASDTSVKATHPVSNDDPLFPATRLYYIDINQNIPPKSWVQVILWLADHDDIPDYTYVTAVIIKNDDLFRNTFYVDDLELLMAK